MSGLSLCRGGQVGDLDALKGSRRRVLTPMLPLTGMESRWIRQHVYCRKGSPEGNCRRFWLSNGNLWVRNCEERERVSVVAFFLWPTPSSSALYPSTLYPSTPIESVLLPHAAQAQSAGLKKGCGRAQSRATLQQVEGFGYAWYRRERWFDGSLLRGECFPRRWDAICKLFFFRCGLDTRRSDREIGKSGFKGQALDDLLGRRRGVMATGRVDVVATATLIPMKGRYKDPRIAPPRHQGRLTRQNSKTWESQLAVSSLLSLRLLT